VYKKSLRQVSLGLLELAVRSVIHEYVYHVMPQPGAV
jgi:hypothetical protein